MAFLLALSPFCPQTNKKFTEEKIELYRKEYAKGEKSKTTNEAKAELTNDMVGQLFATEDKEFTDWLLDTDKVDTDRKSICLNQSRKSLAMS